MTGADILNVAVFGMTAKEWRIANSDKKGNMRDYATLEQLVVLANLENINAILIKEGWSRGERVEKLNEIAIGQMKSLLEASRSINTLRQLDQED